MIAEAAAHMINKKRRKAAVDPPVCSRGRKGMKPATVLPDAWKSIGNSTLPPVPLYIQV